MTNRKNKFNDSGVKVDYIEEVSENQLYDKKNQDDIIYAKSLGSSVRSRLIFVLILIFVMLSISSLIFAFVYFNKVDTFVPGTVSYNLYVMHSDKDYGGNIVSFSDYSTSDESYEYRFSVSNTNSVDLGYKVQFENVNYGNESIDMELINYSLLNNNEVISSGVLSNEKIVDLASVKIAADSNDQLVLKIWSDEIKTNLNLSFKINVI